ncbi:hypothetical protein M0R45_002013 [Rubus argutus]|uniref:Uncharacterized protein n=1 Tax=Rubus argutus TaxID=59490 RepID=A0AAW1VJT7_RUBAR
MFEALTNSTQALVQGQQNQGKEIAELKKQMDQVVGFMSKIHENGKLPSATIPNPKGKFENASIVTTRSGKVLEDKPLKPKKKNPAPIILEKDPATSKGEEGFASPNENKGTNPNLVSLVSPNIVPSSLPFPSRFDKSKKTESDQAILETFKKVQINLPLLEAIKQIPQYAKFLKELCTTRRLNREREVVKVSKNVSAMLQRKLPPKCPDPGSFTIPCQIGNSKFSNCMLDLGASINVMPYSVYVTLGLGELKHDNVIIQLADRSNVYPKGMLEDVFVQVDQLIFPADFYVLEMEETPVISTPLLLGRPFMRTARTKIDVYAGSLTMEFDGEVIGFNVFEAMRYPLDVHSCYSIDVLDTLAQDLLDIMREDSLAPTLEQGVGYTENGESVPMEELLNTCDGDVMDNVFALELMPYEGKYTPPLSIPLSTNKALPSVVQAPLLELKALPDYLKYAYLGDNETLPVIVSSALTTIQEQRLGECAKGVQDCYWMDPSGYQGNQPHDVCP